MKKKFLILGSVIALLLTLGVSYAYFTGIITGEGKQISVTSKNLRIVFTDDMTLTSNEIEPGWSESKTFSVTNESDRVFNYNIVFENLVNTFVTSDFLQYKITSIDGGYTMEDYIDIPKQPSVDNPQDVILAYDIEIPVGTTHNYTIELVYLPSDTVDQSSDMGAILSGNLAIIEGTADPSVKYTVTINVENGTSDKEIDETIKYGSLSYTITPDVGYDITKMNVSCPQATTSINDNLVIVSNVQQNQECTVTFDKIRYAVTVNVVNGTGGGIEYVGHGENKLFSISPNEHYVVDTSEISCSGGATGEATTTGVTIKNVLSEQTCTVTLKLQTYKVDINVTNGRSSALNKVIEHGGSGVATITPNTGYKLVGATVTGENCSLNETTGELTISNVVKAGSCNIVLNKEAYTVSLSGENVVVSDSPKTVEYLGSTSFTVTPGIGFTLSNASVNCNGLTNENISINGNIVTLNNITGNTTCTITPNQKTYDVTVSVVNGSGNDTKNVVHGGSGAFSISANIGYNLTNPTIECTGSASGSISGSTVTISNVTAVQTCTVTLKKNSYTVNVSISGGTSSPTSASVLYNENVEFTISANANNNLSAATVTGEGCTLSSDKTTLTASNVTSTRTCTVTIPLKTYNITVNSNDTNMGTVSVSPNPVTHGGSATITLTPKSGYEYASDTCGGTRNGNTITVSNVTSAISCNVFFQIDDPRFPGIGKVAFYNGNELLCVTTPEGPKGDGYYTYSCTSSSINFIGFLACTCKDGYKADVMCWNSTNTCGLRGIIDDDGDYSGGSYRTDLNCYCIR